MTGVHPLGLGGPFGQEAEIAGCEKRHRREERRRCEKQGRGKRRRGEKWRRREKRRCREKQVRPEKRRRYGSQRRSCICVVCLEQKEQH